MSASSSSCRVASHAGSWYTDDPVALAQQFERWLQGVGELAVDPQSTRVRAIISPHAGYSYSGPTAAYGFKHMLPADIQRIFILGPSHHHYTKICELSRHATYATPLAPLQLDHAVIAALRSTRAFADMSTTVDEEEHSIEMQLPFLAHVMRERKQPFTIVPILVGALSTKAEAEFAKILQPYFADPANFFCISSDFCHWGSRFSYQYREGGSGPTSGIHEEIERLDRRGMSLIEAQDADGFAAYLAETRNTICGRHPIGVLLRLLEQTPTVKHSVKCLHYAQSSPVKSMSQSSVSYVSAIVTADRK